MKCLIIGKVWPEPSSTAAGRRTQDMIEALMGLSSQVHFACAAQKSVHALPLEEMGIDSHSIAINDSNFDLWIKQLRPELVLFDRFMVEEQFGWRVAKHCPDAIRILDTSDLHCLRLAREKSFKANQGLDLQNDTARREVASIYRSDLSLMISEYEMGILRQEFQIPVELLAYWPFSLEPPDLAKMPAYCDRKHLILIGSFMHPPNLDAARWMRRDIWPLIRQDLPEVELHCYGSYGAKYKQELDNRELGFLFMGRAHDALETMANYRLNLAPLRFGAGLKGKVFDGLRTGTPSVMTPIAAEGIYESNHLFPSIARDFAAQVVDLYCSESSWSSARNQAHLKAVQCFDRNFWLRRFRIMIEEARHELPQRRRLNFVGQLLRHHQHKSTEFMSRWIEAKNRSL